MANITELNQLTTQVRRDILRMVHKVNSGHPGGSLGCAEFFVALYEEIMDRKDHFEMDGIGEDLFFLSNGHISPVYYSVLARSGYFSVDELNTFRLINSRLQGHPATDKKIPGVRMASGSLGQGLSCGIGTAVVKKMNGDDSLVYTLHGDGELQEGQIWEAAIYAAANNVDNLIATIDYNGRQIDGDLEDVLSLGNLSQKWQAFGWEVLEVDGSNIDALKEILAKAKAKGVNIHLPVDNVVADDFSNTANTQTCASGEIPDGWEGLDVGEKSREQFAKVILASKTILWNGPMGVFEMENFQAGTKAIAVAVAEATQNGAFSLVGGGDSVSAVNQFGFNDKVSYVSTGGGAMLEYFEGKTLPGIAAIQG